MALAVELGPVPFQPFSRGPGGAEVLGQSLLGVQEVLPDLGHLPVDGLEHVVVAEKVHHAPEDPRDGVLEAEGHVGHGEAEVTTHLPEVAQAGAGRGGAVPFHGLQAEEVIRFPGDRREKLAGPALPRGVHLDGRCQLPRFEVEHGHPLHRSPSRVADDLLDGRDADGIMQELLAKVAQRAQAHILDGEKD